MFYFFKNCYQLFTKQGLKIFGKATLYTHFLFLLTVSVAIAGTESNSNSNFNIETTYETAKEILGRESRSLIILPEKEHKALQDYYKGIYAKVKLDDEAEAPQVFLVSCTGASAFVIPTRSQNHVFYCWEAFSSFPNQDADAYVFAHELSHFRQDTSTPTIFAEYEADLRATLQRIVKLDQRDARKGGDPLAASYNLEAIIKYLKKGGYAHSEDHLATFRLASGLEMVFAKERGVRDFPETSYRTDEILAVIKYVRNYGYIPIAFHHDDKVNFTREKRQLHSLFDENKKIYEPLQMSVKIIKNILKNKRIEWPDFVMAMSIFSSSLSKARNHESEWSTFKRSNSIYDYFEFQNNHRYWLMQELSSLTDQELLALNRLGEHYEEMEESEKNDIVSEAKNHLSILINKGDVDENSDLTVDSYLVEIGFKCIKRMAEVRKLFQAFREAKSTESILDVMSMMESILNQFESDLPKNFVVNEMLNPELIRSIFSANDGIKGKKVAYLACLAKLNKYYDPDIVRLIFQGLAVDWLGERHDYRNTIPKFKEMDEQEEWIPLLDSIKHNRPGINADLLLEIDAIFSRSWEGRDARDKGKRYHFLGNTSRALVSGHLGLSFPKIALTLVPVTEERVAPLVNQLLDQGEYKFLIDRFEIFLHEGIDISQVADYYIEVLREWSQEFRATVHPVDDAEQFINFLIDSLEQLKAHYPEYLREKFDFKSHGIGLDSNNFNQWAKVYLDNEIFSAAHIELLKTIQNSGAIHKDIAAALLVLYGDTQSWRLDGRDKDFILDKVFKNTDHRSGINFTKIIEDNGQDAEKDITNINSIDIDAFKKMLKSSLKRNYFSREEADSLAELDESLFKIFQKYYESTEIDDLLRKLKKDLDLENSFANKVKQELSKILKQKGPLFILGWLNSVSKLTVYYKQEKEEIISIVDYLIDWEQYFSSIDLSENLLFALVVSNLSGHSYRFPNFTTAFINQITKRFIAGEINLSLLITIQKMILKFSGSKASPAVERLVNFVYERLDFDNLEQVQEFFKMLSPQTFQDIDSFVNIVVAVYMRMYELDTADDMERLKRLADIKIHLVKILYVDRLLEQKILERLAEEMKAPESQKTLFKPYVRNSYEEGSQSVDAFHIWSIVFSELDTHKQFQLLQYLRGQN